MTESRIEGLRYVAKNLRNYGPQPRPHDVPRAAEALEWAAGYIEELLAEIDELKWPSIPKDQLNT